MSVLGDIAHARAGDKGDTSIIMVAPYAREDFARVADLLTPAAVASHFGVEIAAVDVRALHQLGAFTVIVRGALDGGVTRSRAVDPHGKTLSSILLQLPSAPASV